MIRFDNLGLAHTMSYCVQQLFATHEGTSILSLTMNKGPVAGVEEQDGLLTSTVCDRNKNEIIVKVTSTSDKKQPLSLIFSGLKRKEVLSGTCCIKLSSVDTDKNNTIENPLAVIPQEASLGTDKHTLNVDLEPVTFAMYILKY